MKLSARTRKTNTSWYVAVYLTGVFCFTAVPGCIFTRDAMVEAARDGNAATIHVLTFLGASPSRVGWEEHWTPLGAAAQEGHADIVALLLRKGANVNERDDWERTALTIAREYDQTRIARMLEAAGGRP